MENNTVLELSEKFRKGLVNRRDFIRKVILSAGGVAAASQVLSQMGFDAGLVNEVKAQVKGIVTEDVTFPSGDQAIPAFLAKPVGEGPYPTMIVISEIFGLSDFIKNVARMFAENGFLALAPCFSEAGCRLPDDKHAEWMMETMETGVAGVPVSEQVKLLNAFNWLALRADVDATHIASVGFCWGGARSFTFATINPKLWAAIVFYGSTPPLDTLAQINCPVHAFYASTNDINPNGITDRATLTARTMNMAGRRFEWEVLARSAHGFFRAADQSIAQTPAAWTAQWLMFDFLGRYY